MTFVLAIYDINHGLFPRSPNTEIIFVFHCEFDWSNVGTDNPKADVAHPNWFFSVAK